MVGYGAVWCGLVWKQQKTRKNEEGKKRMRETKYANATYMGKVLAEGNNTGTDKNGKTWTRFKSRFQVKDQEKVWNFAVFSPLPKTSEQLTSLEEGTTYNIGWNEETQTKEDKEYTSKTLFFVSDPKAEPVTKPSDFNSVSQVDMDKFEEQYRQTVPIAKHSLNHFVGTYMSLKHKNAKWLLEIQTEYKKRFKEVAVEEVKEDKPITPPTTTTKSIPQTPETLQKILRLETSDILAFIKDMDTGSGVKIQDIVNKFGNHAEYLVMNMKQDGDIYEFGVGIVRVLE